MLNFLYSLNFDMIGLHANRSQSPVKKRRIEEMDDSMEFQGNNLTFGCVIFVN